MFTHRGEKPWQRASMTTSLCTTCAALRGYTAPSALGTQKEISAAETGGIISKQPPPEAWQRLHTQKEIAAAETTDTEELRLTLPPFPRSALEKRPRLLARLSGLDDASPGEVDPQMKWGTIIPPPPPAIQTTPINLANIPPKSPACKHACN
ncbi:hypothetical protein Bbelb_204140 [Branchiostoma belcheri]|nr:hypothetical protein Bbelb_204140 [Branchiostoma belcheri]